MLKTLFSLRLALLFFVPCLSASAAVSAEKVASEPAYVVAEFEISDPAAMVPYRQKVESTAAVYGGRYISRGGAITSLEGPKVSGGVVIIRFNSLHDARAWYDSPEYGPLKAIRHRAGKTRMFIVTGRPF